MDLTACQMSLSGAVQATWQSWVFTCFAQGRGSRGLNCLQQVSLRLAFVSRAICGAAGRALAASCTFFVL